MEAALNAMGCLCELSPKFAQVAFDKLVFMVNAMETPPAIKLSAIRVFPKLAHSPYLSIQAHEVDIYLNDTAETYVSMKQQSSKYQ